MKAAGPNAVRRAKGTTGQTQAKTLTAKQGKAGGEGGDWFERLNVLLRGREIGPGLKLLKETEPAWRGLAMPGRSSAEVLLLLAQWVDVGYRDARFLREMLDLIPATERLELGVGEYVRLRMAEAFYALAIDDAEETIRTLDIVLRLDPSLLDANLRTLAHLWKGRAHRRQAEYEKAFEHMGVACELAGTLPDAKVLTAVMQVQLGWLVFQRGDVAGALRIFDEAEAVLLKTDHTIALGNIESARGRIIRRQGDYVRSLHHFNRAIAFYETRHPQHPNLARAVTNLAFVKRLLALQLKKHIDGFASRRTANAAGKKSDGMRLRPLHEQYQELYQSAIAGLERAKSICILHEHPHALAAALLNAGHLHLDVGDLDLADREAIEACEIGDRTKSPVLRARARILAGLIQNAYVEELLGQPGDAPAFARRARQHCLEAVALAESTQNKRLLLNAHLALGQVAVNDFFHDYDLARRCVDQASALIEAEDADYVLDELNALRAKVLRAVGIDDTLRSWSQGILTGKTLQEIIEEFAGLVVTQMWLREGRKISRVAQQLSMSPKKVRRLVRHAGVAIEES